MFDKQINNNEIPTSKHQSHGFFFHFLKWILILLIAFFSLKLLTKPLCAGWSENYRRNGDSYLQEKRYLNAKLAYDKALLLNKKNDLAKKHLETAIKAQRDILIMESFYKDMNNTIELNFFDEVKSLPTNEIATVQKAKELIEESQFQLAIEAAKLSVRINSNFKDGWLYLGIANLKSATQIEVAQESKDTYMAEAKKAFLKAKTLDPENKDVLEYLGQMD